MQGFRETGWEALSPATSLIKGLFWSSTQGAASRSR